MEKEASKEDHKTESNKESFFLMKVGPLLEKKLKLGGPQHSRLRLWDTSSINHIILLSGTSGTSTPLLEGYKYTGH